MWLYQFNIKHKQEQCCFSFLRASISSCYNKVGDEVTASFLHCSPNMRSVLKQEDNSTVITEHLKELEFSCRELDPSSYVPVRNPPRGWILFSPLRSHWFGTCWSADWSAADRHGDCLDPPNAAITHGNKNHRPSLPTHTEYFMASYLF